jgi:pyruvate dehydrogenase E2 component (dihydrolipoamide acetyltransferase)
MSEIVMPRLSDTMEEGTILRWLKADGETVSRGEELVEIETDKATMTYESDQQGVLSIVAQEGSTLAVGEPIARVGEPGAATSGDAAGGGAGIETAAADAGDVDEGDEGGGEAGAEAKTGEHAAAEADENGAGGGERVKASPLARRIARESGVDLGSVKGTGPGGRIVKADLVAAGADVASGINGEGDDGSSARTAAEAPAGASAPPTSDPGTAAAAGEKVATAKGEATTVELTRTQQTIARRMAESKATIPEFTLSLDVDMEECVRLREQLKTLAHEGQSSDGAPHAPTYNDMVVKASALALREFSKANGSYRDGKLQLFSRVNVGVAVAAEDSLVVPTVFDADQKALGEIARETRALAEHVRDGSITPPELGGGTFTVSNLGMFGIRDFVAIINPPQAAILAVGALEPRAVVRGGDVVVRRILTLTLVCDHRILSGAEAARFFARIAELLQAPASLTL